MPRPGELALGVVARVELCRVRRPRRASSRPSRWAIRCGTPWARMTGRAGSSCRSASRSTSSSAPSAIIASKRASMRAIEGFAVGRQEEPAPFVRSGARARRARPGRRRAAGRSRRTLRARARSAAGPRVSAARRSRDRPPRARRAGRVSRGLRPRRALWPGPPPERSACRTGHRSARGNRGRCRRRK